MANIIANAAPKVRSVTLLYMFKLTGTVGEFFKYDQDRKSVVLPIGYAAGSSGLFKEEILKESLERLSNL